MDMTTAISARILAKVAEGLPVQEAMAAVLGADKVEAMISELYDALRAKAVA